MKQFFPVLIMFLLTLMTSSFLNAMDEDPDSGIILHAIQQGIYYVGTPVQISNYKKPSRGPASIDENFFSSVLNLDIFNDKNDQYRKIWQKEDSLKI